MGAKQSTGSEATTSPQAADSPSGTSPHINNAIGRRHRSNESMSTAERSPRSRGVRFSPHSAHLSNISDGQADRPLRQHRSHSTRETGVRIPRPGLEWFFTAHLQDNNILPEDRNASSSSNLPNSFAQRGSLSRSLPPYLFRNNRDSRCPMCHKMIPAEDVEVHFVMCLTKPRVTYNEDIMSTTGGECSICLEELLEGENIARLPCLCVYHKVCIDKWFLKSQTCPEHPPD